MTKRILQILDNVRYWESCPEDYKQDIETFLKEQTLSQDVTMPRKLTAENGAKALLSGEFFEEREISYYNEDGESMETIMKVPISWSTIKDIYDKIVSHYGCNTLVNRRFFTDAQDFNKYMQTEKPKEIWLDEFMEEEPYIILSFNDGVKFSGVYNHQSLLGGTDKKLHISDISDSKLNTQETLIKRLIKGSKFNYIDSIERTITKVTGGDGYREFFVDIPFEKDSCNPNPYYTFEEDSDIYFAIGEVNNWNMY